MLSRENEMGIINEHFIFTLFIERVDTFTINDKIKGKIHQVFDDLTQINK